MFSQVSLDPQQDLGLYLDKVVIPQLPGPVTQAPRTTKELCGVNSKQARMIKTCVAPFSYGLFVRKVVLATDIPNFRKGCEVRCKSGSKSSRRVSATNSWHNTNNGGLQHSVDSVFCTDTTTILIRQSELEEARDIGRRFAPLWDAFNDRLRAEFIDNCDGVPSIDVRSLTLDVADRKNGIVFPAFEFALAVCSCWRRTLIHHCHATPKLKKNTCLTPAFVLIIQKWISLCLVSFPCRQAHHCRFVHTLLPMMD